LVTTGGLRVILEGLNSKLHTFERKWAVIVSYLGSFLKEPILSI
jgi:hypothetical protein